MKTLENLTAFVLDDEEVELFLAQRILLIKNLAIEVKTFRTGDDLISAFSTGTSKPDYLLINYRLNGENGLDVIKKIHKSHNNNHQPLPYFILTSSTLDLDDLNVIDNDPYIDGFVNKPIFPKHLTEILLRLFNSKQ